MRLERFVNGRVRANTYLLAPEAGGTALIVDPGAGSAARIVQRLTELGLQPEAILLTHGHPDHVWQARALAERYDLPTYLHPADWRWLDDPATGGHLPLLAFGGRILGTVRRLRPSRLEPVEEGRSLELAGVRIEVLHTPGHTAGSVCFRLADRCFTGDTVFAGGVGHTVYPGGRRSTLRASIRDRILALPDELELLPGHGGPATVGAVRPLLERFANP